MCEWQAKQVRLVGGHLKTTKRVQLFQISFTNQSRENNNFYRFSTTEVCSGRSIVLKELRQQCSVGKRIKYKTHNEKMNSSKDELCRRQSVLSEGVTLR